MTIYFRIDLQEWVKGPELPVPNYGGMAFQVSNFEFVYCGGTEPPGVTYHSR